MNLRGRSGAVLGAVIVATLALVALSIHLQFMRIGPAREQMEMQGEALRRERAVSARRPVLEEEKKGLEARQAEFREMLPPADDADLEALRRALTADAARAGVLVTVIRPSPAAATPGVVEEVAVAVEAQGDFAALGRFLDLVESQRRAVIVEQFELKPESARLVEGRPETTPATLAMRLTAFRVREEAR
ncbi:MAG: type 4a pilus biogenesis protein PilO [Planctomycetes bacterium]|nr:type 4a pilus biogenesis protein PilO [Planctomycetota bacterium]